MQQVEATQLSYFQFPKLAREKRMFHGVSSRGLGASCNMSFSVSNKHGDPLESRTRFLQEFGMSLDRLVVAGQVHGNRVACVGEQDAGRGAKGPANILSSTDGLMTATPKLTLFVTAADCPPIFLFDPETPAVAVLHSGWRGTLAQISRVGVEEMGKSFGTKPNQIHAAVGPGIGSCCYQVGEDLISQLDADGRKHLRNHQTAWFLDLLGWIESQLQDAGVLGQNIEKAALCTACTPQHFFSHRAQKGDTGRCAAVIGLR